MKRQGRHLEQRWRMIKAESDETFAKSHYRAHAVATVCGGKTNHCPSKVMVRRAILSSEKSFALTHGGAGGEGFYDQFASYFADKMNPMCADLDSGLDLQNLGCMGCSV